MAGREELMPYWQYLMDPGALTIGVVLFGLGLIWFVGWAMDRHRPR